ncbi:unnamed protein product [Lactuca virosa]|uniref:Ubiquitin-like protease family profile domain-containing protein n=1 Tax=Lactuca virosa TaxID=75947 RepID=A0AAU9MV82_9ASTR|nr:unnamed protein product [Lactuca virosa]
MPSFSLGRGLGLTQEFQEGDESSEDEQEKKERKDENFDEEESYDSEETECDNNILGIEDHHVGRRDVGKRLKKPSLKRHFIFDKNIPFIERSDKFESNIKDAMKKDKELLTFEKVHLVFFPVHQKNHFYIICINLEEPAVDVIDNRNSVTKFSRAYRDAPNELKILFSRYLMRVNHKSALILEGVELERVNMNWRTRDNHVDYGVFCMRHMETYMGDKTLNWTCGLPKESKQQ